MALLIFVSVQAGAGFAVVVATVVVATVVVVTVVVTAVVSATVVVAAVVSSVGGLTDVSTGVVDSTGFGVLSLLVAEGVVSEVARVVTVVVTALVPVLPLEDVPVLPLSPSVQPHAKTTMTARIVATSYLRVFFIHISPFYCLSHFLSSGLEV